jgi:hypothetical protein
MRDRLLDIDSIPTQVKMLRRVEKFRIKQENQFLALLYRYQKVSVDERL